MENWAFFLFIVKITSKKSHSEQLKMYVHFGVHADFHFMTEKKQKTASQ